MKSGIVTLVIGLVVDQRKPETKISMLTDTDLLFLEGKQDELLGRLQTKLGKQTKKLKRSLPTYNSSRLYKAAKIAARNF